MLDERTRIQACLDQLNSGDATAWDRLIPLVYQQLRAQAHSVFRNERSTLQATALLHDALADLLNHDLQAISFDGPGSFFAFASRVIRNRLSDHVRRRNAAKRGSGAAIFSLEIAGGDAPAALLSVDVTALHDVLEKLRETDERLWTVTEMKFFCGLTNAEVGEALGVSARAVERDWTFAKAWLHRQLEAGS